MVVGMVVVGTNSPCFFSSQVPTWADNSGSIQRRIILFDFSRAVTNGDMKLGEKLEAEMPQILVKCNRAYLEMVRAHSHTNLWQILPDYFRATRDEMAQTVNCVEAYLSSGEVVFGADLFMPTKDLKAAISGFAQANGFERPKYSKDFWRGPLSKFNLSMETCRRMYNGKTVNQSFVLGISFNNADDGEAGSGGGGMDF